MTKYSLETKLKAIELVQEGYSSRVVVTKLHISTSSLIINWLALYKKYDQPGPMSLS